MRTNKVYEFALLEISKIEKEVERIKDRDLRDQLVARLARLDQKMATFRDMLK